MPHFQVPTNIGTRYRITEKPDIRLWTPPIHNHATLAIFSWNLQRLMGLLYFPELFKAYYNLLACLNIVLMGCNCNLFRNLAMFLFYLYYYLVHQICAMWKRCNLNSKRKKKRKKRSGVTKFRKYQWFSDEWSHSPRVQVLLPLKYSKQLDNLIHRKTFHF